MRARSKRGNPKQITQFRENEVKLKKFGVLLTTAALALTPALANAKTKHVPCGKMKPAHTNCGKHLGKGHHKK